MTMLKGTPTEVRVYSYLKTFSKRLWSQMSLDCFQENSTKLNDEGRGPGESPLSSIPKRECFVG